MVVAVIRVVQEVDVAWADPIAEELVHGPDGPGDRAHVDGHMLGLGDQSALGIAERRREVAARVEDLGVRGPEHGLAHLLDDGLQPVLDDGDGDRVDAIAHERPSLARSILLDRPGPAQGAAA